MPPCFVAIQLPGAWLTSIPAARLVHLSAPRPTLSPFSACHFSHPNFFLPSPTFRILVINFREDNLPSWEVSHFHASRFLTTSCSSSARHPLITVSLIGGHSLRCNLEVNPKFRFVSPPSRFQSEIAATYLGRCTHAIHPFSIRPFGR